MGSLGELPTSRVCHLLEQAKQKLFPTEVSSPSLVKIKATGCRFTLLYQVVTDI